MGQTQYRCACRFFYESPNRRKKKGRFFYESPNRRKKSQQNSENKFNTLILTYFFLIIKSNLTWAKRMGNAPNNRVMQTHSL